MGSVKLGHVLSFVNRTAATASSDNAQQGGRPIGCRLVYAVVMRSAPAG
jgi:hypothetical protein